MFLCSFLRSVLFHWDSLKTEIRIKVLLAKISQYWQEVIQAYFLVTADERVTGLGKVASCAAQFVKS